MSRYTLFAAVSLAAAACCSIGCQNSGHASAEADVDRPHSTTYTQTTVDTSTYTVPYVATTDTSYMMTPTTTTSSGTIRKGDVVYMRTGSPTTGTVAARTSDGRVVYVRAADFRAQ